MTAIRLKSSDDDIFNTDTEVVKCSATIINMLEDCGTGEEGSVTVIPLSNVNGETLGLFLKWASYHLEDPIPLDNGDNNKEDNMSAWDSNFFKVNEKSLFDLILAAHYLDAKALYNVACTAAANLIKGKSTKDIRETFDVKNDLSPADEERIIEENKWSDSIWILSSPVWREILERNKTIDN